MTEHDDVAEAFIKQKRRDLLRLNRIRCAGYSLLVSAGLVGTHITEAVSPERAGSIIVSGVGIAALLASVLHRPSPHGGSDYLHPSNDQSPSPDSPGLTIALPTPFADEVEAWLARQDEHIMNTI